MEMIMMMDPAVKCLCLLAVVAILFVTEKLPLAVTSVFAAIFCWLLGLVPIEQVFLGLADSTVVLFGGMFIVGAAMFYTGLAQDIGGQIVKLFGTGEIKLMVGIMVIAAVMSAFLSNTGTTACLIPVVIGICKEAHIPVSREMMPPCLCGRSRRYLHPHRYPSKHHCERRPESGGHGGPPVRLL